MGLFDKLFGKGKGKNTTQTPIAAQPIDTPPVDTREIEPIEVHKWRVEKSVEVSSTGYYEQAIMPLGEGEHYITIHKSEDSNYGDQYYIVCAENGQQIGVLYQSAVDRFGIKANGRTRAVVCAPKYRGEKHWMVFIPLTDDELSAKQKRDELKLWINIKPEHWHGPDEERQDYGPSVWVLSVGDKPTITLTSEGVRLFDVTPRMKCYADVMERTPYPPRRVICERKSGEYGVFYHVGLYF